MLRAGIIACLLLTAGFGKPSSASSEKALTPGAAGNSAWAQQGNSRAGLPAWALQPPHFVVREGRLWAVAVGQARARNLALARAAAADRARAALLRLLKRAPSQAAVEGTLYGSRISEAFVSRKGRVFIQVEAQTEGI